MADQATQLSVWDDATTCPVLSELSGVCAADACVIGLGGSGLHAIECLLGAGLSVVGVDRTAVAAGAAGRNGGFLLAGLAEFHHRAVRRFGRDIACGLYAQTRRELDDWFACADTTARRCGSLRIAADARELADCQDQAESMQADGFDVQMYDGEQGKGLLFPGDGVFQPVQHWRRMSQTLLTAGARLFGQSEVKSVQAGTVHTARGEVRAPLILLCVDGGLERLLPTLAGRVRSARLQMLATAPMPLTQPRPVYYRDGHDYWQQLPDGRLALGGGRDVGHVAEWGAPAVPSTAVQSYLDRLLLARFDDGAMVRQRWAAEVAFSEDGLPVFGELQSGVFVSGAYNGTGNVLGALCGRALAMQSIGQINETARLLAGRMSM